MLNIKSKSKMFLTAFVFLAMVSFSHGTKADVLIDCSGKEGYQLQICEQQKALAEKNAKSNEKAQKEAEEEAKKAAEKAKEATESVGARPGETGQTAKAAQMAVQDAQDALSGAESAKKAAQKEMTEALARGDTQAAQKARDKMIAADKSIQEHEEKVKAAEKQAKAAEKADKKVAKANQKAQEAAEKAAKKAEKNANKDLKNAQKDYNKMLEKCEKNPEECDVNALQEAQAKVDAAKANADAATKAREDVDGTTAANEAAAAAAEQAAQEAAAAEQAALLDSFEEEEPIEAEIQAYNCKDSQTGASCTLTSENASTCKCEYKEVYTDEYGNTKEGAVGTFDKLDSNGNPVAMQRCYEAKDDVFKYIACKAMTTLADVRVIVYTLAGFGLIAFAFAAIFNKISWKHLANLCIALFILSMMTPFIEYFTQDSGGKLTYGNYLPAGFTNIDGSDIDATANCDTSKGDVCPDVNVDTSAKDSKWSWKDLKNTVKSGINAAKTAYDTYKTAKQTVETTIDQAQKIGTAIKNSEGGLTGVLDTLGEVATASNTIFNTVQTGANAVVSNTSSIATDVQNAGKSSAELAFDQENQARINELETKLAAGNLSAQEQEWAKAELEQRKAAVDSNKVVDFANNQGQQALDKINQVAKTGATVSSITTTASNAAQQGATIGGGIGTASGDTLGAIFGLATAAGEGIGAVEDAKQAKIDAANAEKEAAEKAAAEARRQEEIRQNNASYSQGKQWDNSFNASMTQTTPAVKTSTGSTATSSQTESKQTQGSSTPEKTASGQLNFRSDEAPNGTITTLNKSYYSPEQEAFDNAAGRNGYKASSTETQPGSSSVTRTYTYSSDGKPLANSEGVGGLPASSSTTTVTIDNARENKDGTMEVVDEAGRHVVLDKDGNVISSVNYITGEQWTADSKKDNNQGNWGNTPSWGQF